MPNEWRTWGIAFLVVYGAAVVFIAFGYLMIRFDTVDLAPNRFRRGQRRFDSLIFGKHAAGAIHDKFLDNPRVRLRFRIWAGGASIAVGIAIIVWMTTSIVIGIYFL